MRKPWSWSKVLIILALTVVTLAALPAAQAQASFAHGAVVALQGTPHLWIADEHGVLHWGGDTRALAGKHVNWGDRTEVSLEQLRTLPVGDPWLSAGLLKDGDPIYLVKWESDWAQPQLLHIQSIKDVELFGINGSNYGNFVLDKATWEAQLGLSAAGLQRGVLAAAVPASERAATVGLQRGTPNWVFAGNVPDAERTALREEIEAVRTWYSDQYGVEATDLTVLVGATAEALASEFRDVTGRDLLGGYVPPGYSGPSSLLPDPFITTADDGSPVIVLIYGSNPFDKLKDSIVHEYFHALQNQLLASRYQVSEVEPYWLVEGLAMYTDHAYSQSRPGRRPFLGDNGRMTPYEDLADAISLSGIITPRYLENIATESTFRDGFALHPIYTYALAFAGAHFLVGKAGEDSVVEFWRLIQQRPTWQQAFGEAFGMGIEDFYDLFRGVAPGTAALLCPVLRVASLAGQRSPACRRSKPSSLEHFRLS